MKKYKHKTTGVTVTQHFYKETKMYPEHYDYEYKRSETAAIHSSIDAMFVENSNDWEEVIEPNYLITAFKCKIKEDLVFYITIVGTYGKNGYSYYALHEMLTGNTGSVEDGTWEIYSVKNKDGVEFAIGENVRSAKDVLTISKFEINGIDIIVYFDEVIEHDGLELIQKWSKPKPIFVSADGKEFFDTGETITIYGVWIAENDPISYSKFDKIKHEHTLKKSYPINTTEWLWFVDDKLSQEYIDNNKPKYSLKDIEDCGIVPSYFQEVYNNLKKLGK